MSTKNTSYPVLYTPEQAALVLGISPTLVRRYCRQGRLGQSIGGHWLITPDDLQRFQAKPRKSGNPEFGPEFRKSQT